MIINWLPTALLSSARPTARHPSRVRTHQQSRLRVEYVEPRVLLANPVWTAEGPGPINGGGGTLGITNNPSVGAIRSIVVDPTDVNTVYVATVNGGIWKTTDATDANPIWTAETDSMPSLSTSSISIDPANHNVLVAGTGRYSSDAGDGGPLTGVQLTTDGGATWQALNGHGILDNVNMTAALVRNNGATIVVASAQPPLSPAVSGQTGIYRSTDGGATFSLLSGNGLSGLPTGQVFDLVADPNTPATMYAAVGNVSTGAGIYKSTDSGATWTKISNATQDGELASAAGTQENAKIAVGPSGFVDVVIDDTTAGVSTDFISQYDGATWTTLDSPSQDGGLHTAGMGMVYLSIAADTTSKSIVYVGGDQEPAVNTIGASGGGGRLFRIDASLPSGTQATALTNSKAGGNSNPPADSRFMVMDSTGRLLEADDGGIYVRAAPTTTTGAWSSMIGNIANAELLSAAYEQDSHRVFVATQGNSSAIQSVPGSATYNLIQGQQAGALAIDATSLGHPRVFTSQDFLTGFEESDYDNATGNLTSRTSRGLVDTVSAKSLVGGGASSADPSVAKYTPLVINTWDATYGLLLTNNLWESRNSFINVTKLWSSPGGTVTAAAYGDGTAATRDIIVAGDSLGDIAIRESFGSPIYTLALPSGVGVKGIAVNPTDWTQSYILDANGTIWHLNYSTVTHTGTFTAVTTLPAPNSTGYEDWRTLAAVPTTTGFALVAGGYGGVYSVDPTAGTTKQLGTLPNAVVNTVVYNKIDDVLVAGTLGRGAYKLSAASTFLASTTPSISIPGGSVTFNTPPATTILVAGAATVNEPVAGVDFHNGNLTVTTTNGVAGDTLSISVGAGISVSGNTISFGVNQIATFSGGTGSNPLVVTFLNNGFETTAAVQAVVRHITFTSTSFSTTARNVTLQVTDSQPQTSVAVPVTVNVVLATTPILVIAPGPVSLNNAPFSQPVQLAAGSTLIDTGTGSFQGGELSVTISNNGSTNDRLLIQSIGGITSSGNSVLYNGNAIGLVTGGFAGSPLVVQFTTANATTAAVQALMQAIAFNNTVDPVSTAQRTVTFQAVDSLHATSNSQNVLVNIVKADTPPVINLNAQVATYTEGNPAVTLAPGAAITYTDGPNFQGGSLTTSLTANATPFDQLVVQAFGGITVSGANVLYNNVIIGVLGGGAGVNGNPLAITFTSPQATIAAVQALIQSIGFSNSSNNPSTLPRTAQFVINDGRGGLSAPAAMTVNVVPVDNSPTLVLGPSLPYLANTPPGAIAPSAIVTDPDTPFFTGGTLIVSESLGSSNDQLLVLNQGNGPHQIGVSGASVFDAGTLIGTITSFGSPSSPLSISLNGNASQADVQDLVRAIGFGVNGPVSSQTRFFNFSLNDGGGAAPATDNTSVGVNNGNTAPIVILQPAVNYTSGSVPVLVSPISVVSDPDSLDFNGGSLMVTLGQGGTLNDRLSIQSQGAVMVNGQSVYYGGVLVGTLTAGAGFGLTPLVVNFNSQSSAAAAQAILGAVQFSTFGPLSAGVRLMQATVTDNHQLTSTPATEQINVTLPVPPVVITLSDTITYLRKSPPVTIDPFATLSDINAATFPGGSLTFQVRGGTNNKAVIANTIDIQASHGKVFYDGLVIGKLHGNTVQLNANATVSAVQALIQSVKFSTHGIPGDRTATFLFDDGVSPVVFASKTIIVR